MSTTIKLITVGELLGKSFHIPSYQRGYKWTQKQVEDLLNDIEEFIKNKNSGDSFYCLQPLAVVKKSSKLPSSIEIGEKETENDVIKKVKNAFSENVVWDVIDGQQRLTTIYLILCYLKGKDEKLYSISYETREKSFDYLQSYKNTNTEAKLSPDANVDFYHINQVYRKIVDWFADNKGVDTEIFKTTLLDKTQFIWYETADDAIEVFTRMNIGKIGLTNSELIKALIVSKLNDKTKAVQIIKDWDSIEKQLQNDEFWYFIHSADYNKPTRIDYLFDTLCDFHIETMVTPMPKDVNKNEKKEWKKKNADEEKRKNLHIEKIGTDKYRTFRHYDLRLKDSNCDAEEIWKEVISLYEVLIEWYNNLEYYHYIGYILCHKNKKMSDLYKEWENNNKVDFFEKFLKPKIQEILTSCCKQKVNGKDIELKKILDQQYELDKCPSKTVAKPILLLHNIQTVINQNKQGENQDEFKHPVFFRFPFHLYKNQKWDVEHIDSNSTNDLKDNFSKLLWLLQYRRDQLKDDEYKKMYEAIIIHLKEEDKDHIDEEAIKTKITNFSFKVQSKDKNGKEVTFDDIASKIGDNIRGELDDEKKNQIGNFTLLDASTNRGYGNSIFPAKRKVIMAKDRCMEYQLKLENKDGNWEFKDEPILSKIDTFIPPVTRNVFMKYYTPTTENFSTWNEDDFDGYRNDVKTVLSKFLEETNNNK